MAPLNVLNLLSTLGKNLSKLVTLVSYMVFKYPLELENVFNGLMDDLREVGEF